MASDIRYDPPIEKPGVSRRLSVLSLVAMVVLILVLLAMCALCVALGAFDDSDR